MLLSAPRGPCVRAGPPARGMGRGHALSRTTFPVRPAPLSLVRASPERSGPSGGSSGPGEEGEDGPRALAEQRSRRSAEELSLKASTDGGDGDEEPRLPPSRTMFQKVLLALTAPIRVLLNLVIPTPGRGPAVLAKNIFGGAFFLMFVAYITSGRRGRIKSTLLEVPYSQFVSLASTGNVQYVKFHDSSSRIYFDVRTATNAEASTSTSTPAPAKAKAKQAPKRAAMPVPAVRSVAGKNDAAQANADAFLEALKAKEKPPRLFYTQRVANDPGLIPLLNEAGVQFGVMKDTLGHSLRRMLSTTLMLWLPLLPMFWIMRRMLDQRNGGKKPARKDTSTSVPTTTFSDVAGVESAKEELAEVVACLRDPARFAALNARMPGGVLLCGPPGTGKTLLARAVAGEAGVPFFSAAASEFVEMFVGRGAARVRELFAEARKQSPSVVFIDELDAVGGRRGVSLNDERDQTLNQLLTELDGFEAREGVLLLAATNRPDVLDPALMRPGRISRRVTVPLPDETARQAILRVYLDKTPLAPGADPAEICTTLAIATKGFNGAELANVVNEAALLAARRGGDYVTPELLVEGVSRTKFGVNGAGGGPAGAINNGLNSFIAKLLAAPTAGKPMTQT